MDWEPDVVAAQKCRVELNACRSISQLLKDGCTIPFICRYRTAAINDTSADKVREIQRALRDLENVSNKVMHLLKKNEEVKDTLKKLEGGGQLAASEELKASVMPFEVIETLKKCTTMTDVSEISSPYHKRARRNRADAARALGLQPIVDSLLAGTGAQYCYRRCLNERLPHLEQFADVALAEAIILLLSETVAKHPETFDFLKDLCNRVPPNVRTTLKKSRSPKSSPSKSSGSGRQSSDANMKSRKVSVDDCRPDATTFANYFNFVCHVKKIESHQVLAINRGERLGILSVSIEFSELSKSYFCLWCRTEKLRNLMRSEPNNRKDDTELFLTNVMNATQKLTWSKYIQPQLSRRIRSELTKKAESFALQVFARNLRALLLTPPLSLLNHESGQVMGIDPGYINGCKIAILERNGNILHTAELFLHHGSENVRQKALKQLKHMVEEYEVIVIAIGDGTASRETELLVSMISKDVSNNREQKARSRSLSEHTTPRVKFVSISEAGVSIWSVSKEAEMELPQYRPTLRSAIGIARRLIDPLSEFTKVAPRHLGIGMYQLDLNSTELDQTLLGVIEECVSMVGVDLNSVPTHLLQCIAGLGPVRSAAIINYREQHGRFQSRQELLHVRGIGVKLYQQCAGFLRVRTTGGPPEVEEDVKMTDNDDDVENLQNYYYHPLDSTCIHPESYCQAESLMRVCRTNLSEFKTPQFKEKILNYYRENGDQIICDLLRIDCPTLHLLIEGLTNPHGFLDIRTRMEAPLMKDEILKITDLELGMTLKGRVTNVVTFGVFVDLGIGVDGLLHRTEIPSLDCIFVGQLMDVKVIGMDTDRQHPRITLGLPHSVSNHHASESDTFEVEVDSSE